MRERIFGMEFRLQPAGLGLHKESDEIKMRSVFRMLAA